MSAVRLARHAAGRDKLIKFEGCYHGHADGMLVRAGSGALTFGAPDSGGVPEGTARLTLTARYNDLGSVRELFRANSGEIAAVIVEPAAANMGVVPPEPGFLQGLREICDGNGALLIFDEVITGFRLAPGGAQELFGVRADIVAYGKIIGGGLPAGAFGARRELMELIAPAGPVYHAGTLSGNPVAVAAGLAQLKILDENRDIYARLDRAGARLAARLTEAAERCGAPLTVNRCGSLVCAFFTGEPVRGFGGAAGSDGARFSRYHAEMTRRGIYIPTSRFEALFVGAAHTDGDIDAAGDAAGEAMAV